VVLVSSRGRVALIRRRRAGREYWSFPGGGIKSGESPSRAARREVAEELGLDVRPERLLAVASGHALFLATIDGEPRLRMRGPEVARPADRDRYRPEWVPLDRLPDLDVRPRRAQVALTPLTARPKPPAAPEPPALPAPPVAQPPVAVAVAVVDVAVADVVDVAVPDRRRRRWWSLLTPRGRGRGRA